MAHEVLDVVLTFGDFLLHFMAQSHVVVALFHRSPYLVTVAMVTQYVIHYKAHVSYRLLSIAYSASFIDLVLRTTIVLSPSVLPPDSVLLLWRCPLRTLNFQTVRRST